MNTITIKTQAEFDALPASFSEFTRIEIRNDPTQGRIYVSVARENSSVEAWENSSVVAMGNSSVVARENSSVEAWENSSVEARGNVGVHLFSDHANIILFMYAVCWVLCKNSNVKSRSKTATIIEPAPIDGTDSWLESQGIEADKNTIVLYKRVSVDFKTQENTANETLWNPGVALMHPSWSPDKEECGEGKFHACSKTYFCDQFRSVKGDRYIAINVKIDDLFVWTKTNPSYPHKIAFRKGTVLYECDKMGRKI